MSSQNPYVEVLIPIVIVSGCGTFGRLLGHEHKVLINGISSIIKDMRDVSLSHVRLQRKDGHLKAKKIFLPRKVP